MAHYDIVIDTTTKSPEEVFSEAFWHIEKLK
jgi:hypothetical protein